MVSKYTNIGLPNDLLMQIDKAVQNTELGYRSRGEFVKEAVRVSLKELRRLNIDYDLK